ncbi:MAG TPA: heme ABC exporter ATP-binding protein CcmA [Anaerolineae bacterium]|nr:heme ABC exporter ATP-binding protein CcmA [Anaerolineae bacterium]
MTTPLIEVTRLRKAFGRHRVLKGIDMRIEAGSSVVMFGPNGAGKTTFLRILATLSKPTSGTVRVAGVDIRDNPEGIRQYLGLVGHAPLLYDDLTAYENLRFYARLYGMEASGERIRELLERVGLWHRRHDLVRTFSRGMVQRMAIARALLHNPPILLLDEPDTGLDPQAAEMMTDLLREIGGSERTIIMTTHHLERGLALADRVLILVGGEIVFDQPASDIDYQELRPLYDAYVGEGVVA